MALESGRYMETVGTCFVHLLGKLSSLFLHSIPYRLDEYARRPRLMTMSDIGAQAQTLTRRAPPRISPSIAVTSIQTASPMRYASEGRFAEPIFTVDCLPFQYHTGRGNFTFDTLKGKSFTQGLNELAKAFNLSSEFGLATQDYTISQLVASLSRLVGSDYFLCVL